MYTGYNRIRHGPMANLWIIIGIITPFNGSDDSRRDKVISPFDRVPGIREIYN